MLIPLDNGAEQKYLVSRDGTTWIDLSSYITDADINLGNTLNVGTGNNGADDTVRKMNFTLKNEGVNRFSPLDQGSTWNIVSGSYDPLLDPGHYIKVYNREMQDRVSADNIILVVGDGATTVFNLDRWPIINPNQLSLKSGTAMTMGDLSGKTMGDLTGKTMFEMAINGETAAFTGHPVVNNETGTITFSSPVADGTAVFAEWLGYWATDTGFCIIFDGYIHEINSDDLGVNLPITCKDRSRLLDKYVDTETQYGSAGGTALETVIQDILDDNYGAGVVTFTCPASPGFAIYNTPAAKIGYCTVWEAIQNMVKMVGWFFGYWKDWSDITNEFGFILMEPPRSKTASLGNDYYITSQEIYAHSFKLTDEDVRNKITVKFFDQTTKLRDEVTVTDATSIARFGTKSAVFEMDQVNLIDSTAEATDLANVALADLKDMPIGGRIDTPIFMRMDVFTGLVIHNALVSSTDDFYAVCSVRHYFRYYGDRKARTESILNGKVVGGHIKWLKMENATNKAGNVVRKVPTGTVFKDGKLVTNSGVVVADTAGRILDPQGAVIADKNGFNGKVFYNGVFDDTNIYDTVTIGDVIIPTGKQWVGRVDNVASIMFQNSDVSKTLKAMQTTYGILNTVIFYYDGGSVYNILPAGTYTNLTARIHHYTSVQYLYTDATNSGSLTYKFSCYYEIKEMNT